MTPASGLPVEPIRRIAVFRALVLGDLLCATPALRVIRHAWADAHITLIGLPWARSLAERLDGIDRFVEFPGFPGLPEVLPQLGALPGFIARMQQDRYDLLLQLHGSGSIVNPLMACFGARHVAGFDGSAGDPQWSVEPPLHTRWPESGHEIERMLAVTDHLGLERRGVQLDFPVTDDDRASLERRFPELVGGPPFVCMHPGAQLPSRRWPPARFAAVADALARSGLRVVLTGAEAEAPVTAKVRTAMREPALDLTGRTSLFELGALIEGATLLVCNDTGVSHVAAALRTPSVVVSSGADVARWAPLDAGRHRVLWADTACRPCGHRTCPTAHECAQGVGVGVVLDAALGMCAHA